MPIYIRDSSTVIDPVNGTVASTMGAFTAAMVGTNGDIPDFDGAISRAMGKFTARFRDAPQAFPGAEGFGTETVHGRGGIVVEVTNLNDSGAGSFREAILTTEPRIITFTVSGTITVDSPIIITEEHSYCGVFGQTAPGGGICLGGDGILDNRLFQISNNFLDVPINPPCHDLCFQHIRIRHGSLDRDHLSRHDCVDIYSGTYNVIFDHCSFSWASDEIFSIWNWQADPAVTEIKDITISHCIIAEGDDHHNTGCFISGGAQQGQAMYNISYHHNYSAHLAFRDIYYAGGSDDSTKGVQAINNIHYDVNGNHHTLGQNQYATRESYFDSINECFIGSSRESPTWGVPVYNLARIYTNNGDTVFTPYNFDDSKIRRNPPPDIDQSPGVWYPISVYADGNTYRDISLNILSSREDDELNNELMINKQYKGSTSQGGPYDGGETYDWRISPMALQPINPVTITSALQAHTDLIVNEDCGAFPHDSVDARIVASCLNGTVYDKLNVPGYPGSSATWPTLTDTGAPTDTSGNGLPDYYQVNVLNKDIDDTYNPADTYTLVNGYSDIENWIHTLTAPFILPIPNLKVVDGSTHDMSKYIIDPHGLRTDTEVTGLSAAATYDSGTELLTGVSVSTETGLQLLVTA